MNTENLNLLIDTLQNDRLAKEQGIGFNMQYYHARSTSHTDDKTGHDCGTVACIGGTALILAYGSYDIALATGIAQPIVAGEWLGIDLMQSFALFYHNSEYGVDLSDITRDEAITTLEKLRDTGNVDWSHIRARS